MATTADFRNGMCLDIDGQYFFIVEFLHVKPGKGPAFVRTKLHSVATGCIISEAWNSDVEVGEVRIERRPYRYLYNNKVGYHSIHPETFDQVAISESLVSGVRFLKEGDMVRAMVHVESEAVPTCRLPVHMDLHVTHTEPGIKGNTATSSLKPATVEAGARIRVPLFISQDDLITVGTRDGSYVGHVKE